jgi:3'-phosphoadenosine 5'-phosphosulfate sulfotransferase (PAPS reductase)/FAD synthetase
MSDPFLITEPTVISFSGGRTSAYMLWRALQSNNGLPAEAMVCFANTGKEDEATLRFVQDCSEKWNVPITWLEFRVSTTKYEIVTLETASRNGEPFEALIKKKNYLPNPVARFCSEELKAKTIERFTGKDVDVMIGVRADEPRRISKLRARGLLLPLYDAGITQFEVQSFWKAQSFDLNLPFRNGITALGNCDLCFLKGPQQIKGLIKDNPERATWWANQEKFIGASFRSDRPTYAQMQKFINDQADMFNADGGIDCFCGE